MRCLLITVISAAMSTGNARSLPFALLKDLAMTSVRVGGEEAVVLNDLCGDQVLVDLDGVDLVLQGKLELNGHNFMLMVLRIDLNNPA